MPPSEGSTEGLTTAQLAGTEPQADRSDEGSSQRPTDERSETAPEADKETDSTGTPLLSQDESSSFRTRWEPIQAAFVDDPRRATEQADALVAEVMQRLAVMFNEERSLLEARWEQGTDVSTEDLRIALQRYRSFFHRLLST
jgi:hypothetical protein